MQKEKIDLSDKTLSEFLIEEKRLWEEENRCHEEREVYEALSKLNEISEREWDLIFKYMEQQNQ